MIKDKQKLMRELGAVVVAFPIVLIVVFIAVFSLGRIILEPPDWFGK